MDFNEISNTALTYYHLSFSATSVVTTPYRVCSVWRHCDVRVCLHQGCVFLKWFLALKIELQLHFWDKLQIMKANLSTTQN